MGTPITLIARAVGPAVDFSVEGSVPVLSGGDADVIEQRGRLWQREWLISYLDLHATRAESVLRVSPSMLALLLRDYARWQGVTYDHTVQAANLLLMAGALAHGLQAAGAPAAPEMIPLRADLLRAVGYLLLTQNADGGWGAWPGDGSRPFETSLALQSLQQAADQGLTLLPAGRRDRAVAALLRGLARVDDPDLRAYVLYVLSLTRADIDSAVRLLWLGRAWLSTPSLAYVGLALDHLGALSAADRETLLTELHARAAQTSSFVWWTVPTQDGRLPEGAIYGTAVVVQALLRWGSMDEWAGKAVDWLLRAEPDTDGTGEVTVAAAQRIVALTAAAPAQEPTEGTVRVALEGVPLLEERVDAEAPLKVLDVNLPDLRPGSNWVEIRLEGTGPLYFVSTLRSAFPDRWQAPARSSGGFAVRREYLAAARGAPTASFAAGEVITVRLYIDSPATFHNVAVSDPVPAGCSVIADSLESDPVAHSGLAVNGLGDTVRFWLPTLPPGRHTFTYQLRAGVAGRFRVLPAVVFLMHRPSLWGRSSEIELTVD